MCSDHLKKDWRYRGKRTRLVHNKEQEKSLTLKNQTLPQISRKEPFIEEISCQYPSFLVSIGQILEAINCWQHFCLWSPGMLAAGRLCEMVGSKALDVDRFVRQWRGVVVFLRFLCGVNLIPIENPCMVYINHKKNQPNADRYEVRPVQSVIGFTFCHGIPTMFQTIFSGKNARVTLRFLLHNCCCCCGFLLPNYMVIIDYSDGIHGATKYMFADLPYIYSWNLYGIRR